MKKLLMVLLAAALVGCAVQSPTAVQPQANVPTPTVHFMFQGAARAAQGASTGLVVETGGESLPLDHAAEITESRQVEEVLKPVTVYSEAVAPGWSVFSPGGMKINANSTKQAHSGRRSIEVTPVDPESKLYIALVEDGEETYPRSQVAGISFWLYSGAEELDLYDLAVTAVGSNELAYYEASDRSGENQKPYEETFLYWLGFNDNIPAHTWVEVQIWLDQMLFDPEYRYVTGLYLTNRFNFKRTFWIDDVSLILIQQQPRSGRDAALDDLPPALSTPQIPQPTPDKE